MRRGRNIPANRSRGSPGKPEVLSEALYFRLEGVAEADRQPRCGLGPVPGKPAHSETARHAVRNEQPAPGLGITVREPRVAVPIEAGASIYDPQHGHIGLPVNVDGDGARSVADDVSDQLA